MELHVELHVRARMTIAFACRSRTYEFPWVGDIVKRLPSLLLLHLGIADHFMWRYLRRVAECVSTSILRKLALAVGICPPLANHLRTH